MLAGDLGLALLSDGLCLFFLRPARLEVALLCVRVHFDAPADVAVFEEEGIRGPARHELVEKREGLEGVSGRVQRLAEEVEERGRLLHVASGLDDEENEPSVDDLEDDDVVVEGEGTRGLTRDLGLLIRPVEQRHHGRPRPGDVRPRAQDSVVRPEDRRRDDGH